MSDSAGELQHGGRMKLAAHRECAAIPGPAWPESLAATTGCALLPRAGAAVLAAVLASVLAAVPAPAQQTIIIGDDKPSGADGAPLRPDAAGVVINTDVLDSLGSGGPAPALPPSMAPATAPSLPYAATAPAGGQATMVTSGEPGTAYRLPGTGQLVISRPSTLLFPPPVFPTSHLSGAAAAGRTTTAAAPDTGKAQSRLLVPKPAEPTVPKVTQPKAPAVATAVPRQPVTREPMASDSMAKEPSGTAATAAIPPATAPEPAPAAEPPSPPAVTVAPKAEPIEPASPPAVATLPAEPAPAAEAPPAAALTRELQPDTPSPKDEPAATEMTPKPEPEMPAVAPKPEPSQSAALTPSASPAAEMRLVFSPDSAELTTAATGQLDNMAKKLLDNAEARVQLLAYAQANEEGASRARRLSLSRALAVRAYLIEKGVRSTRMDVRALGSGFQDGPPDRVDILPQESSQ